MANDQEAQTPDPSPGLGNESRDQWPSVSEAEAAEAPIDVLRPNSERHRKVRTYLLDRIDASERAMSEFYSRWQANEKRIQAYIDLPDYEKALKEMSDSGKPPQPYNVVIPYSYATVSTIVTYLIHTFAGRKPMFQVGAMKRETVRSAQMMEQVLQYQSDHTRLIRTLFQYFNDASTYGVGVLKTLWKTERAQRTVWRSQPIFGFLDVNLGQQKYKTKEWRTVYEGNEIECIDPYMFFPDPRVPMTEVNRRGEYVFWRSFEGKHLLKRAESDGDIKYVDYVGRMPRQTIGHTGGESDRDLISKGRANPGSYANETNAKSDSYVMLDQGTIDIIPAELGLGTSEKVEKWIFTIANRNQIIQAEPLDLDHGKHPVAVTEPWGLGHGFGEASVTDYLGPIQDVSSWFINSHIMNVRSSINNNLVVDPSMIEMQDLEKPPEGREGLLIRLKRAAYGQDVRQAVQQLNVQDVTRGHIDDLQLFMTMGDALSAVTENIRGQQAQGGRKTATEVRTSGEAAASRLASLAKRISAEGIVDLTEQMCVNTQQNMTEEFYLQIAGQDGMDNPIQVSPEMLVGDFYYPIHDGTLPLDRVALLDVWKELFMAISQDPELRQMYNVGKIFDYIAELGGARNLESFKAMSNDQMAMQMGQGQNQGPGQQPQGPQAGQPNAASQVVPDDQAQQQAQQGNAVPIGPSGNINANPERAAQRQMRGMNL